MAERSGPWGPDHGDGQYSEDRWQRYAALWLPDGVAAAAGDPALSLSVASGTPRLSSGRATIAAIEYENDAPLTLALDNNPGGAARVDAVMLRMSRADGWIRAVVVKGGNPSTPPPPPVEVGVSWLPLWAASVAAGGTVVTVRDDLRTWHRYPQRTAFARATVTAAYDAAGSYFPGTPAGPSVVAWVPPSGEVEVTIAALLNPNVWGVPGRMSFLAEPVNPSQSWIRHSSDDDSVKVADSEYTVERTTTISALPPGPARFTCRYRSLRPATGQDRLAAFIDQRITVRPLPTRPTL